MVYIIPDDRYRASVLYYVFAHEISSEHPHSQKRRQSLQIEYNWPARKRHLLSVAVHFGPRRETSRRHSSFRVAQLGCFPHWLSFNSHGCVPQLEGAAAKPRGDDEDSSCHPVKSKAIQFLSYGLEYSCPKVDSV